MLRPLKGGLNAARRQVEHRYHTASPGENQCRLRLLRQHHGL